MKRLLRHIVFFLMLTATAGCQDDFDAMDPVGEGMATLSATVDFKPMVPALTRSDGKALGDITSLYLLFYDSTKVLKKSIPIVTPDYTHFGYEVFDSLRNEAGSAESSTRSARFTLWDKIEYGKYYVYAVANIKDLIYDARYVADIQHADSLKNLILGWDEKDITQNGEMIGHFTVASNMTTGDDVPLVVNRENVDIHAWLRRAASKVTVRYDGSGLYDGVKIYILAVSIKDIPRACLLGNTNIPTATSELIHDGETLEYYSPGSYGDIAAFMTDYPYVVSKTSSWHGSDHSETDSALYFYENMQGAGIDMPDKRQDANADGVIDHPDRKKDAVTCGTYIEVDAIYTAPAAETEGGTETGTIKYRFMLGKDVINDYNAERNCHYQLTLAFNGTAKDIDWHIDYQDQVFEVTPPKVMDYRGKVFLPEYRPWTKNYNLGHNFGDNSVTVSSYIKGVDKWVPWEMTFSEDGTTFTPDTPSWIDTVIITDGYLPYIKNVQFRVKEIVPDVVDIDDLLQQSGRGSSDAPYNLANPAQGSVSPAEATIQNTANCYVVDGPGWYLLPLVYGNAIKGGEWNEDAYAPGGNLPTFKDYLGKDITSPYIQNTADPDYTPQSAFLLWQDEDNLINYSIWNYPTYPDIKYLPSAYDGKGGIEFQIKRENIKQGNAVIALSTMSPTSVDIRTYYRNVPVMWSWHIWVTNFSFLESDDKTIEVTGHDLSKKYRLLPFNLGWCSNHIEIVDEHSIITPSVNDPIKYYKGRKCLVKFSVPGVDKEEIITLEQKSHIATTRGTSPYYQWGRKDPFIGASDNADSISSGNKMRYYSLNWGGRENPPMLFDEASANDARATTKEALSQGLLIKNPQCWHNPKRAENIPSLTGDNYVFRSLNETYTNLWGDPSGIKTVYDPCPVGYQVPSAGAFSGFTTTGHNTDTEWEWYNVRTIDIADYDATDSLGGAYCAGLYEFYTNPDKVQSIVIPESGYRDWDDRVCAYKVNITKTIGYLWTATYNRNPNGNHKDIYNFEFARKDETGSSYIRPKNRFYSCDAFPVRPVAE